jgi:hypothetical protein
VSNTWKHLGFQETSEEQLAAWDVEDGDLVHMQNTLQVGTAVAVLLWFCCCCCCCSLWYFWADHVSEAPLYVQSGVVAWHL